jgi:transposase-like protein
VSWKETAVVDERLQFVEECKLGEWSMAEACRRFEISRKTGYKWLARYESGGMEALKDQSHAPLSNPRQVLEEVEDAIVEARGKPGAQHDWRDSSPAWLGSAAKEATEGNAQQPTLAACRRAQSGLVCRF